MQSFGAIMTSMNDVGADGHALDESDPQVIAIQTAIP